MFGLNIWRKPRITDIRRNTKKSMQSASKRLRESLRVLKSSMVCGIHILED